MYCQTCSEKDVLVAYPCLEARALRVQQFASLFPEVHISVLVEDESDAEVLAWNRSRGFHRCESGHESDWDRTGSPAGSS